MLERLEKLLGKLWAATIKTHVIDFLRRTIKLDLEVIENRETELFSVIFEGVSSMYYVDGSGEGRFRSEEADDEWQYLECSEIMYEKEKERKWIKISSKCGNKWADEYYSEANFVIEIWSAVLLIEAQSITINGEKFSNLMD